MELEALKGTRRGTNRFDCLRCFERYRKCGVFDFSHGAAPTLRRAFSNARVLNTVSPKDKAEVGEELKVLFPVEHTDMTPLAAYENLRTFARR